MLRVMGLGTVCSEPKYKAINTSGGTLSFRIRVTHKGGTCYYNCSYCTNEKDTLIDNLKEETCLYLEGTWYTYNERKENGLWNNINVFRVQTLKMFNKQGEENEIR